MRHLIHKLIVWYVARHRADDLLLAMIRANPSGTARALAQLEAERAKEAR